jgi:hypothetical protein
MRRVIKKAKEVATGSRRRRIRVRMVSGKRSWMGRESTV